jgi:hypothetical protein
MIELREVNEWRVYIEAEHPLNFICRNERLEEK